MKLIKYPGKEAWSELFDLVNDPYETRNLYSDVAYSQQRAELESRYAQRSQQIGYHVPEYADEKRLKAEDLLPEAPAPKPANAWVLDYSFWEKVDTGILDRWVTLKATVSNDRLMELFVDDRSVGQAQAKGWISRNPNDGLQVGADTASPVEMDDPPNFHGQIQRI